MKDLVASNLVEFGVSYSIVCGWCSLDLSTTGVSSLTSVGLARRLEDQLS